MHVIVSASCPGRPCLTFAPSPAIRPSTLVAVSDVDLGRTEQVKKLFPEVRVYQDLRGRHKEESNIDSADV